MTEELKQYKVYLVIPNCYGGGIRLAGVNDHARNKQIQESGDFELAGIIEISPKMAKKIRDAYYLE